eukprot:TRINITY_DN48565_c0_g1_i1.p1 TRINITY_DN48565_c0_g1~~TRINITY_DN48565_c0_g1_i1.p1  ORF type:complete len:402 (-),score=42.47 TRINITY_DN48565_c0_g1_i1:134-1339(-)
MVLAHAPILAGEWVVSASVLQCEDAVFGRVHFTKCGELVYLPSGDELIGRGVGTWFAEGPVIGFQINIFQYAPTSTKHVQSEPHLFMGISMLPSDSRVLVGEWYFCAYQQPPRLVGKFKAHRRGATGLVPGPNEVPEMPKAAKNVVVEKLLNMIEPPSMVHPRWAVHERTGPPKLVHYVRNWLEPPQQQEFGRIIAKNCEFERMSTRDTQEFGSGNRCKCGRGIVPEHLPPWLATLITALHNLGVFHPVLYPANSVRINAYNPGQGIHPHFDSPVYYPRVAIISLLSACVFDFLPRIELDEEDRSLAWDQDKEVPCSPELPPSTEPLMSLVVEPGSLLVFSGDAFTHHRHGIKDVESDEIRSHVHNAKDMGLSVGDVLKRDRRVSLTIRHLLPRCNCTSVV